jgi:PAS domain S-box-containing protein
VSNGKANAKGRRVPRQARSHAEALRLSAKAVGEGPVAWDATRSADAATRVSIAQRVVGFGMWEWEPSSGRVRWSPELEDLFGLPRGTFGGTYADFARTIFVEDRKRYERIFAESMAHDPPAFDTELRIVRPSGELRWIKLLGVSLERAAGEVARVAGVCLDITERRQAEERALVASSRLGVALKSSKLIIFRQDRALRYTWGANLALGLREPEVIGRTDDEVFGVEAAKPLRALKERVLGSGCGARGEVCVSIGGRSGVYDLFVEPDRDPTGQITGVVCAAMDISDRKQAEREREAAQAELHELAHHLQESIEAERASLARDVHDQIGAMLTGIAMKLADLAEAVPASSSDRAFDAWSRGLEQARGMVNEAVAATRELSARLRPALLDDLGLVEACRWHVREWARAGGLRVRTRFGALDPEPDAALRTDLFRSLQELLTNVARHAGAATASVSLAALGDGIRLRVTDDGRGFAGEPRRGIGLAGLRERARQHGGRVDIDTGARGTTVTVTMRRASER